MLQRNLFYKMELKFVVFYLASWVVTMATAATIATNNEDVPDNEVAETGLLSSLTSLQPSQPATNNANSLTDLGSYPYEGAHQNIYDTFATPQPTFGISINTRALLAPKVEALRLLEDFFTLLSDIITRISTLFNDNYGLIQAVFNLVVSKLSNLKIFILKIISALRLFLEFALNLFAEWSVTLPSITLGSSHSMFAPHEIYGVPSSNTTSFV